MRGALGVPLPYHIGPNFKKKWQAKKNLDTGWLNQLAICHREPVTLSTSENKFQIILTSNSC